MFYWMSQIYGDKKRVALLDYWNMQIVYEELYRDLGSPQYVSINDLDSKFFENYFTLNYDNNETLMFIKR